MSSADNLRNELSELASLLESLDRESLIEWSPEWMGRQSLLTRDAQVRHELSLVEGQFAFEIQLSGETVHDSSVEASFLGHFLEELQGTVNAVGQSIMFGDLVGKARRYPVDVLTAASMRLVGTHAGSFVIGLEGPERDRQLSFSDEPEDEALPVFDEAISRLLDVVDVAEAEVAAEALPQVLGELGGERPLKNLVKLAKLLASHGTTAVAIDRSPFRSSPRESTLTSAGARRLQTLLSRTRQSTVELQIDGRLTGVRWKSGVFDLEPLDGAETITGKIASEIREDVQVVFDTPVKAIVERTVTKTEVEGAETTTFRLVGVNRPVGRPASLAAPRRAGRGRSA